jgi:gluconokinase
MTATAPGRVVVGLDVGTTGVKAAAFGLGSSWRWVAIREYPLLEPVPGQHVQDPITIVAAATSALAECVADGAAGADVMAISVSAGMHGLMALDADQHPLTRLITWADGRAGEEARWLHRSGQAMALHASTGVPVHPMTPLTKLVWFARHDPATWSAARWWIGLKDYLLLWLTGTLVTELSSATGTGLVDMSTRSWSTLALDVCGVAADRLPEILPTTATLGLAAETAHAVGLPAGTPVVVGAADGPLGNLGTGAMAPGVAGLSLGTSGAVRMAVNQPRVDTEGALFCYALTDSVWVLGGAISNGGSVIRWVGSSLAPDITQGTADTNLDASLLELAAGIPPGSDGLVMLPYLLPERAPLWDPGLAGAYLGLRTRHTRAHLVRAAIEGVCLQMRLILDTLTEVEPVTSVRGTGGAFRSTLWRDVMAATLGRPLSVVDDGEGTALGAATLGLVALGCEPTLADAAAQLSDAGATRPHPVKTDPLVVAAYDRVRASVPALVADLDLVAAAFARAPAGRAAATCTEGVP